MCNPPLTIVTAPGVELGRLGVEALLCRLQGATPPPPVLRAGELRAGRIDRSGTGLIPVAATVMRSAAGGPALGRCRSGRSENQHRPDG